MSSVDHIFYISDILDQNQRTQLQFAINQHNSVHSVSFDRRRKQFIAVAYDPDEVSCEELRALFIQNGVQADTLRY